MDCGGAAAVVAAASAASLIVVVVVVAGREGRLVEGDCLPVGQSDQRRCAVRRTWTKTGDPAVMTVMTIGRMGLATLLSSADLS